MLVDRLKNIALKAEELKKENLILNERVHALETELSEAILALEEQKNKNNLAENNLNITKFANVLGNEEGTDVKEIQAKLDYFINHIDRCINLLKD